MRKRFEWKKREVHLNRKTAVHLVNKCLNTVKFTEQKTIYLFDTALEMYQWIWPDCYLEKIKYYESVIGSTKYVKSLSASNGSRYYKNTFEQPSLAGITQFKTFGFATKPIICATYEGQSYMDFTFTVFHEIGHNFYNTGDEIVANSFAKLYNIKMWKNVK